MLNKLQNNLFLMHAEKMKQFNYLQIKKDNNKKMIQEILFSESHAKKINNIEFNERLNFPILKKKKELKLINFQIENEIEKTKFLIEQKSQLNLYVKSIPFFLNTNQEIFCKINYENIDKISKILKNIQTSVKDKFVSRVKEKMEIDLEINQISLQIKTFKDQNKINDQLVSNKKYIDTEEIIYEESKENNKTIITNQSKRNSYASLNKINSASKIGINPSKKMIKKHLSIDALMKDSLYRNNILALCQKSNEHFNDNKSQINNYLNMNINVNINVNNGVFFNNDNYNYTNSSLNEDNDDKSEDFEEKKEEELNKNNKVIDSPIQIKDDNKDKNKYIINEKIKNTNNISYKFEMNDKKMMNLYSKSSDYPC